MRYIKKKRSPEAFERWKETGNDDWEPGFSNLRNPEKETLHDCLLMEQGMVCCYCGRRVDKESSHIEHFQPQELSPELALDYANLHASCIRETVRCKPLHCGHLKSSEFDGALCISPLDATCEQRFRYALNGRISEQGADDFAATYMIKILGLDIAFLRNRREQALLGVFDDSMLDDVSLHELSRISEAYRAIDASGKATDFGHVVAVYADQLRGAYSLPP